jgi:hypothetical protein
VKEEDGWDCSNCGQRKTSDCFYGGQRQCKDCDKATKEATTEKREAEREGKEITEKECILCQTVRPIIYFYHQNTTVDGFDHKCMFCTFVPNMIKRARKRNQWRIDHERHMPEVSVTVDHINSLPKICAYSKVPLVFCPGHINMASLDRIDDNDGYTIENSQLVDIKFNTRAKWTHEKYSDAFGPECESFIEQRKESRMSPLVPMDGKTLVEKLQGLCCKEGRTMKLLTDLWENQGGLCYYSGIPMTWGHIDKCAWTVSVERLERGSYTAKNTRLVCGEFNSIEYATKRFEHLFNGVPQGWNREVVESYRTRERNATAQRKQR